MRLPYLVGAQPDGSKIAIRIGIHTGPVTAGVIGEAKVIFDVWGDTVNIASRMQSHGIAGRVQVTDTVRAALADEYDFSQGQALLTLRVKGQQESGSCNRATKARSEKRFSLLGNAWWLTRAEVSRCFGQSRFLFHRIPDEYKRQLLVRSHRD